MAISVARSTQGHVHLVHILMVAVNNNVIVFNKILHKHNRYLIWIIWTYKYSMQVGIYLKYRNTLKDNSTTQYDSALWLIWLIPTICL